MPQQKTVLKKEDRKYYAARPDPEMIELQEVYFITIEGEGKPGSEKFQESINAIFSLAYRLKFDHKAAGSDFSAPNLEALWWKASGRLEAGISQEDWRWKLIIRVPGFVTSESVEQAKKIEADRKGRIASANARLERMEEGKCAQILHIGRYEDAGRSYGKLKDFIEANGMKENGAYHEIYLSDPSKTAPGKLTTIIRIPVA